MSATLPPLMPPRPNAGAHLDYDRPVGYSHAIRETTTGEQLVMHPDLIRVVVSITAYAVIGASIAAASWATVWTAYILTHS